MKPTQIGQVAKFHTPLPDENPDQLYVVLEIIDNDDRPRADIKPLNTGLSFPPINTVSLNDLEVVEVDTSDLIGYRVTVNKADYSQASGKVVKVSEQKVMLNLSKGVHGVETNVWVTIRDEKGQEHTGTLFVS
jgi:flagellar biosynthesis/type III secretory pathway ATPase